MFDTWIVGAFIILQTGHIGAMSFNQVEYRTEEECKVIGVPIAIEMIKAQTVSKDFPPIHHGGFGCYKTLKKDRNPA